VRQDDNLFLGSIADNIALFEEQRIQPARALYREPKLLVMDEATAHLDINNEGKVNLAISELGITRIIIAHRQEQWNRRKEYL
jgi:ATP-binding cassette subfamily B protein RaxB